jgi:hypothetical protein
VSVSEDAQASYLARYYLLMLGSGMVERVYWWQLVARGYGLADRDESGLRRRRSWQALAFLARAFAGSRALGPVAGAAPPLCVHAFARPDGARILAAWSADDRPREWKLPAGVLRLFDREGRELAIPASGSMKVGGGPIYAEMSEVDSD